MLSDHHNVTHSIIDLGTNTVLMVTGRMSEDGTIEVLGDEHRVGRLGKGVDAGGRILPETLERIVGIFLEYGSLARENGADLIAAYGTSALRDASNRSEFIDAILERTGIELRLLSGTDEAEWTWRGALFGHDADARTTAVLDIGGGSTEIAFGSGTDFEGGTSIDVGAVRITERFFGASLPPGRESVEAARSCTRDLLERTPPLPARTRVVGVAGTITTLAAIKGGFTEFRPDAIDGTELPAEWIRRFTDRLLGMSLEEIERIPQVRTGREDILPAGALILREFVEAFDVANVISSTRGLRYGLLMKSLADSKRTDEVEKNRLRSGSSE